MELTNKEKQKCYRLAQKIDMYEEKKDGCYWGHILEIIEKAFIKGKKSKQQKKENCGLGISYGYVHKSESYKKGKEAVSRLRSRA